jgi:hypothetical protein
MPLYVKDAGTWKQVKTLFIKDAGTWKQVSTVYVKDAGVWKACPVGIELLISADTTNYNIKNEAIAAGWDGITPTQITVTVQSGVYVSATGTSSYAMDTGSGFPAGTTITIINNGFIIGKGGNGGGGGSVSSSGAVTAPGSGSLGGPALRAQYQITIFNYGTIAGGGNGGNGGSAAVQFSDKLSNSKSWGGGGGGGGRSGKSYSSPGSGGTAAYGFTNINGSPGAQGTNIAPGGGGGATSPATSGSSGGAWGGGKYAVGNSYITWAYIGTRYGGVS